MTALNERDYERFTWKYRKILLPAGIIIIILRIIVSYTNINPSLFLIDILTILDIVGFLFIIQIFILYRFKNDIRRLNRK